jgi:hypothetical protein
VVFDWAQSYPLKFEDGIIHIGEDGRPDNAIRALQEVRAYTTHPRQPGPHVTKIEPLKASSAGNCVAGGVLENAHRRANRNVGLAAPERGKPFG